MTAARTVLIPAARVERWFENFAARHGPASYDVRGGALHASAPDGAEAEARLPFARPYAGPGDPAALAAAVVAPDRWGVLLVRKGGFAVARLANPHRHGRLASVEPGRQVRTPGGLARPRDEVPLEGGAGDDHIDVRNDRAVPPHRVDREHVGHQGDSRS